MAGQVEHVADEPEPEKRFPAGQVHATLVPVPVQEKPAKVALQVV